MVRRTVCVTASIAAVAVVPAVGAANPVAVPKVEKALVAAGYPARPQCGAQMVPPRPRVGSGQVVTGGHVVPTCRVVVEQKGYSVQVIPYTTSRLARLAYERTINPAATTTRKLAIGNVVLSAYRIPKSEWLRISRIVAAAVAPP
jgi:hypothetical protein